MRSEIFHLILVIALIGAIVIIFVAMPKNQNTEVTLINEESTGEVNNLFDAAEIKTAADGTKYIINPNDIGSGGPPKGGIGVNRGIPALAQENINFVSVAEANEWIEDNELVLAIEYGGEKRVYPLQILVWHEIANDEINGDPLLITYCPLCGTGIAYNRQVDINGEKVTTRFGVSGKLYNSNLIMYDEETDTYWQQIDGKAIVGELTGQELEELSVDTVVWRDWKNAHPDSKVLSQETGFNRDYGRDPYGNYYEDSFLFFPVENEDNRIYAKEQIIGIEIDGQFKAYTKEDIKEAGIIEDSLNRVNLKIEQFDDGKITVTNTDTGEEIIKEEGFWFSWYAFHPETKLYSF